MSSSTLAAGIEQLRGRLALHYRHEQSDEQVLQSFLNQRDHGAFATLVRRHGPMVLQVCRRVLGHEQDAEDAFQATFLVLARNAASLRNQTTLAGFLHGTAYRTAMKAKQSAARRRKHEGQATPRSPTDPAEQLSWREAQALLDEEIARLADIYRSVFILCCMENLSRAEVGQRLGLKERTVLSRLAEARKRLRQRLSRRGIELVALLAAIGLTTQAASALPAGLLATAIKAALATVTGAGVRDIVSALAVKLAQGATTATMASKAKMATVLLAASLLTVVASGSLALLYGRANDSLSAIPAEPPAAKAPDQRQPHRPGQELRESVEVGGRVVDPNGKPVAGARVVLEQRRPNPELPNFFPAPATGTTDADGRFRFTGNVHINAPVREYPPLLTLTAHVPGYGPAAVETNSPDELKDRTLRLVKDDVPIRGRILNLEGRPIEGVTVRPVAVVGNAANDLGRLIEAIEANKNLWEELSRECYPNIVFSAAAAGLTQTAKTDSEGKFTLSGFGRERIVVLRLDGPTIETSLLNAMTRKGPTVRASHSRPGGGLGGLMPPKRLHEPPATYVYSHGNPFDFAPGPGIVVEGTVRDQDTDRPIAGVVVRHGLGHDFGYNFAWAQEELTTTTDASGNYRLAGLPRTANGPFLRLLHFDSPRDQPYLPVRSSPTVPAFGKPTQLDVHLKRGVWVKGRVTDKATGQPVQAQVEYFAFEDNPDSRGIKGLGLSQTVSSKKDGSFTLAALRGRGIVAVKTDEMRQGMYLDGQGVNAISGPRDERIESFVTRPYLCHFRRFNTLVEIDPDARAESVACDVKLDPGKTVKGTILDPDGKPLTGARIRGPFLSLVSLRDLPSAEFAIPAVNPRKPQAYFFEHPKKNLSAAVILKGDEPEGFTVKLKPTAAITGRLVTERGEPVRNTFVSGRLEAGQLNMNRAWNGFFSGRTDDEGRFKIAGLLAGVKLGEFNNLFANLTLEPGEVRNLGDMKTKRVSD